MHMRLKVGISDIGQQFSLVHAIQRTCSVSTRSHARQHSYIGKTIGVEKNLEPDPVMGGMANSQKHVAATWITVPNLVALCMA